MPYGRTSSLFDVPEAPYQAGSDTSREAALAAKRFIGQQGIAVLEFFARMADYGATQKEASSVLEISRASMAARVNALERAGRLLKTGRRRGKCEVYQAVKAVSA